MVNEKHKSVLLVIDMLNDFCHKNGQLSKTPGTDKLYAADIVENVVNVVTKSRDSDQPIIWLCDSHSPDDPEFRLFGKHAEAGTWGSEIIEELKPARIKLSPLETVIKKTTFDGFHNTNLNFLLKRMRTEECVVAGLCTSICVMDTVGGIVNRGFAATVIKDAVADFDSTAHEFAIKRMSTIYGAKIA
jgi:nicotinamidase-related amidase